MSNPSPVSKEAYLQLCDRIQGYDYFYYALGVPAVPDAEYDALVRNVADIEKLHPDWIFPGSPTQKVGSGFATGLARKPHASPMLSLDNIFDYAELEKRAASILKLAGVTEHPLLPTFVVQHKLDGLALSLTYKDGVLVQALTRGDGVEGEDVTANAMVISNIPRVIPDKSEKEVRGEVVVALSAFRKINDELVAQRQKPYAHPRNYAVGALKLQDPQESRKRHLRFVAYYLHDQADTRIDTYTMAMAQLKLLGFAVPSMQVSCTLAQLRETIEKFGIARATMDVATDGAVFKLNSLAGAKVAGANNRALLWAYAYKYEPEAAVTVLENIRLQVGRTGAITPVAEISPVDIGGTMVARASLHNESVIAELDVRIGDSVVIHKAGEIIPQIKSVLLERRPAGSVPYQFPIQCPECQTRLVRPKLTGSAEAKVWNCPNAQCAGRRVEVLLHWCAKDNVDIEDIGDIAMEKLSRHGVKNPADLYDLKVEDLMRWLKCSPGVADKLVGTIQRSKTAQFERVLSGLGLPKIGSTYSQKLAYHFQTVLDFFKAARSNMAAIEALKILNKPAVLAIQEWVSGPDGMPLVTELAARGVHGRSDVYGKMKPDGPLTGKVFVFTGELGCDREDAMKAVVELGGRAASAVSGKTTYLVAGNNTGQTKLQDAKKHNVKVIDEAEFNAMLQEAKGKA